MVAGLAACAPPLEPPIEPGRRATIDVDGLENGELTVELDAAAGAALHVVRSDGVLALPAEVGPGEPFTLRVVVQPEGGARRCFVRPGPHVVEDGPIPVRCRIERVCHALAQTRFVTEVELVEAFPDLERPTLGDAPIRFTSIARAADHYYLGSQSGQVYRFAETADARAMDLVLDLRPRVQSSPGEGLVGLVLHPRFPEVPHLYVQYVSGRWNVALSRFTSSDEGASFDPESRVDLFFVPKPHGDHNGGLLAFGPDGMLYAGFGDGGFSTVPHTTAQDRTDVLGSIVRVRVAESGDDPPYAIPADNPFVGEPGVREEIWAFGLRNPFRGSFDSARGGLFVGDVGQHTFEEIDRIERGANYGWPIMEGFECFAEASCDRAGLTAPVHVYPHTARFHAIIVGPVYRGTRAAGLGGSLLFADYETNELRALASPYGTAEARLLAQADVGVVQILEDAEGEPLLLGLLGEILRMEPAGVTVEPPARLSDTGCMDPADPSTPALGFVPYEVLSPLWSDDAQKQRFVFVPHGERLGAHDDGRLELPPGGVLLKDFRRDGRRLETRAIVRRDDGGWVTVTYRWNEAETEAHVVREPELEEHPDRRWLYPAPTQCRQCHTRAAGLTLGLTSLQLGDEDRERFTFHRLVEAWPSAEPLVDPHSEDETLERRARAYLHANCAPCHRPTYPISPRIDLRWSTPPADTGLCTEPVAGDLGIADARVVVPGAPERSVLAHRMGDEGASRMPPLGSFEPDPQALALIREWIESTPACDDQR